MIENNIKFSDSFLTLERKCWDNDLHSGGSGSVNNWSVFGWYNSANTQTQMSLCSMKMYLEYPERSIWIEWVWNPKYFVHLDVPWSTIFYLRQEIRSKHIAEKAPEILVLSFFRGPWDHYLGPLFRNRLIQK